MIERNVNALNAVRQKHYIIQKSAVFKHVVFIAEAMFKEVASSYYFIYRVSIGTEKDIWVFPYRSSKTALIVITSLYGVAYFILNRTYNNISVRFLCFLIHKFGKVRINIIVAVYKPQIFTFSNLYSQIPC